MNVFSGRCHLWSKKTSDAAKEIISKINGAAVTVFKSGPKCHSLFAVLKLSPRLKRSE